MNTNRANVKCPECGSQEITLTNKFTIQLESLFGPILILNVLTIVAAVFFPITLLVLPFTLLAFLIGLISVTKETIMTNQQIKKQGKIFKDYDLHCHDCNCVTDVLVEITKIEDLQINRVLV